MPRSSASCAALRAARSCSICVRSRLSCPQRRAKPPGLVIRADERPDFGRDAVHRQLVLLTSEAELRRRAAALFGVDREGDGARADADGELPVEEGSPEDGVQLAERLGDLGVRRVIRRPKIVPLEIGEDARAPRADVDFRAERVEKKVRIGEADHAVVVEVVVPERRGKREARREIVIEPRVAVGLANGDGSGVVRDRVDALGVRGEGAAETRRPCWPEHRTLEQIDAALGQAVLVARGLRACRREQEPDS